jgi:DNA-binding NarL/FixJ family response regulator
MYSYYVHYSSPRNIWSEALSLGFDHLAASNPGWCWSVLPSDGESTPPNLSVLDLTTEQDIDISALPGSQGRLLVLVRATQKRVITALLTQSRCSLLCVDDHQFEIKDIVDCSHRHKRFLSPFVRSLKEGQAPKTSPVSLTETESKILAFIRDGKSGVEISRSLFRSQKTISSHKRNIMRKFGVSDDLALKRKLQVQEMAI